MFLPLVVDGDGFSASFSENLEDQVMHPLKMTKLVFAIGLKYLDNDPVVLTFDSPPLMGLKVYVPKMILS